MGQELAGDSSPCSSAESSFRELDDVFLQTQTRIWLGEVLHTRLDEQLNISDLLADGELLFEVSKTVWKMLLTKCMELRHIKAYKYKPFASRKSSGRYLPYSNVDSFFKICKILGLTGIDLFSPSDVVEKRNTRKVCMCIRSLSKKARSKHLNVPDFDIVTYTVSMPTDMVGCIRRSLELSQCSFLSSASYSPYKDSKKMKGRQKNSFAVGARTYDLYFEESDDTESNYMVVGSHSPSKNCSYNTANLMNSDFEDSPGLSSVVDSYTLAPSVLQLDIQEQEKHEYTQGGYQSLCLAESVRTPYSQCAKDDNWPDIISTPSCVSSQIRLSSSASHINNGAIHSHHNFALPLIHDGHDLGTGASIVGDSVSSNTLESSIAHHLAISDLIDPGLSDGEDNIYNEYMGNDSHGSKSTQKTFQNGFGRIFSDDIEDVEVSSVASMSSVSVRKLNLDFEDQFDEEDDFSSVKVQLPELQSGTADLFYKSYARVYESQDRIKYETMVHSSNLDTENPQFDMNLEDIGFSTKCFESCLSWKSFATGYPDHVSYDNGICVSQRSSNLVNDEGKLLPNLSTCLTNKIAIKNVDWGEVQGFLSLSNRNDDHEASPKFVSSEGILEEFLHCIPTKASGDALWLKDMKSVVAADDMEMCTAKVVKSDPDTKEHPNNYLQDGCFNDIIETGCVDPNGSPISLAVEESEKCCKLRSTDGGSCFHNQNRIIQDINGRATHIPDIFAEDNPSVQHNFVFLSNTYEPAPEKHNCFTIECSEDLGKRGDQVCTDHSSLLCCAENMDELDCQDERKDEEVNVLEVDNLDGRENITVRIPECKTHKRPFLKSVIRGTALFGVLFLVLHLRRSGREKTGEGSQTSQIWKANVVGFSPQKGQKGGRVNGFYPAEKLKFGD